MRIIDEGAIRAVASLSQVRSAVRGALESLARGTVVQPDVIGMELAEGAEVHVKGAFIHGCAHFTVKVVGGYPRRKLRGQSGSTGSVFVFDAVTGELSAVLQDNGLLTELRTAAVGAVAADVLARHNIEVVGVIGTGSQARYQIPALLEVRQPRRLVVYGRNRDATKLYADEMARLYALEVQIAPNVEVVTQAADLLLTVTSARQPLVRSEWVRDGTHITAVGADMPGKQELDPQLLGRAKLVVDRLQQAATQGELQHALAAGLLRKDDVWAELGDILIGRRPGRTDDLEVTVADLTGVGVLDAAVAELVIDATGS